MLVDKIMGYPRLYSYSRRGLSLRYAVVKERNSGPQADDYAGSEPPEI
jgi:hypothetical protein